MSKALDRIPDFIGRRVGGYLIENVIGSITECSCIYSATGSDSGKYVFKWIRPKENFVPQELAINRQLANVPFCATAIETIDDIEGSCGFIMPFFSGGDLWDHVFKSEKLMTEEEVKHWSLGIGLCLWHMHKMGLVHRDIKPENILLHEGQAYLTDFGLSAYLDFGQLFTAVVGSERYQAPEMLMGLPYNESVDMWAFGVTLYYMFTQDLPFPDRSFWGFGAFFDAITDPHRMTEAVRKGMWNRSLEARTLVEHLLVVDPKERWTSDDVYWCDFYRGEGDENLVPRAGSFTVDSAIRQADAA
jgi:serine/threonine protein kinase